MRPPETLPALRGRRRQRCAALEETGAAVMAAPVSARAP